MAIEKISVAFWNLENLFDVESADRPERMARLIGNDLVGWDDRLLKIKLSQLSLGIRAMNGGRGPDILGVAEVENKAVLLKLVDQIVQDGGRRYAIAHADTSDNRGIDTAFLYDQNILTTSEKELFQHWIVKRYATREILQANFTVNGQKLVFICNHWPSRSAGQYETEPYRIVAGETLAYWIERIHQELGETVGIVVMGDFNDDPFSRSLTEYALSTNDKERVQKGKIKYLYNLMWPILAAGRGTLFYNGAWSLFDQILVNSPILSGKSGWHIGSEPVIESLDIVSYKENKVPHRFGIKPSQRDPKGFSDHFPVSVVLKKAKN